MMNSPRRGATGIVALIVLLLLFGLSACNVGEKDVEVPDMGSEGECSPSETRSCACSDGVGIAMCGTDGEFGACECEDGADGGGDDAGSCPDGFRSEQGVCVDVDECVEELDDCDDLVDCTNTNGGFSCAPCPDGYDDVNGDGTECVDVDECTEGLDDCDDLVECANEEPGYSCGECPMGYVDVFGDGTVCEVGDPCADGTDDCDPLVTCTSDGMGGATCGSCPGGYTDTNGDGTQCDDIDECAAETDNCAPNATCTNMPGSFDCECDRCTIDVNGNGTQCNPDDSCSAVPGPFIADTDTIALWHFDEGSGAMTADASGNGLDVDLNGANWGPGQFDDALIFGGSSQYAKAPTSSLYFSSPTDFTIEAWVKRSDSSKGSIFDIQNSIGFRFGDTDRLSFVLRFGSDIRGPKSDPGVVPPGSWHHVAGTYDGAHMRLWVDGMMVAEQAETGSFNSAGQCSAPSIGAWCLANGAFFNGGIDELRISSVARYAPVGNWNQLSPPASGGDRQRFGMAYDSNDDEIIVFGGHKPNGKSGDTWKFDGTTWTQLSPSTPPSARNFPPLVYDSLRDRIVLFAGERSPLPNDTWVFDGNDWTQLNPATPPSARKLHAMVYDTVRDRVVVFGGVDASDTLLGETWEFDGTTWSETTPATSPPPRTWGEMAYAGGAQEVVLFGGRDSGTYFGDTWVYDGTTWTEAFPSDAPSPRRGHEMVYDPVNDKVILFGGYDGTNELSDTWAWDGTNWTELPLATSPTPRVSHEMIYDSSRDRIILYGGNRNATGTSDHQNDTWELR